MISRHSARSISLATALVVLPFAAGSATSALAESAILTPCGDFAIGFRADDSFTDQGVIGAFDVLGDRVAIWGGAGLGILNRQTGTLDASPGGVPAAYLGDSPPEVDVYNSFVSLDPDGESVWVGFTTDGNLDDRIYRVAPLGPGSWEWTHRATLTGNFEMAFHDAHAYASSNPTAPTGGSFGTDASVYLLDASMPGGVPSSTHDLIALIGGYSAGLAFDDEGNLYYGSYLLDASWNSYGALYRFPAAGVADAQGGGNLTLTDAEKLSDLPHGASDVEVDLSGHVMFTMKQFAGPNYVAMWDGQHTGDGDHWRAIACGSGDEGNFLLFLKAWGDFTRDGVLYVGDADYLPYPGVAGIRVVPEPSAMGLLACGAAALPFWLRRRRRRG